MLASYKGGSVTDVEFTIAVNRLPARVRGIVNRQKKEFLESYITERLLLAEAEKQKLAEDEEVKAVITKAREKILVAKLIEQEVELNVDITDAEVREYYDAHSEEFMNPFRLRASHILVRSRGEAEELLKQIKEGEDFAELAEKKSLDPTGPQGGDLGYFQKGQLIPEIEEVAFSLSQGELSEVVHTSFGFHIIKVTDSAEPQAKEFESVQSQIRDKLQLEQKSSHFNALTERLTREAGITVNEELLAGLSFEEASST